MIPEVTTEVAFSTDPNAALPTWTDISAYVKNANPNHGRDDEYSAFGPGTNSLTLNNNDRRFDPTYAAGPYYPNVLPNKRIRQYSPLAVGLEFWGDFELGADGTAPEWTAMNGAVECKAGSEARQLTYAAAAPAPRVGTRRARFEVASGDKFGVTTGERCEVRRGTPNGGFATGTPDGVIACYQFSFRPLGAWTHPSGWEIFHQQHSFDARFGQAMLRFQVNGGRTAFVCSLDTGEYPTLTDANNGTNAGTNYDLELAPWAVDVWHDVRYTIRWSSIANGFIYIQMKQSTDTDWLYSARVASIQTLPTVKGNATVGTVGDKIGFYRNDQAITNVVFHDGYQVAHTPDDAGYGTQLADSRWNDKGWENREQATAQVGNPDFEVDITGTASAGGGVTTRTWDTTRSKFGTGALKMVTNGAASGQGAFHTKRSGSRYDVVEGHTYTASAWFSGDGFEQVRIGIEWFTSGGASISTTYAEARALRTDFRRHYTTQVAPATAASMRIRTGLSGTNAATFWVDGVDWWEGTTDHTLFEGNIDTWATDWPDRLFQSDVQVQASDRFKRLAARAQPTSNPSVEGYEEVVNFDQPVFYYRMGEPEGTKLISHVRRTKKVLSIGGGTMWSGHHVTRRWKTRATKAEVEGVSGPSGTYKNLPTLGVAGAIAGDSDTAVAFDNASNQYARIELDVSELIDGNRLTVELWAFPVPSDPSASAFVGGPESSTVSESVFWVGMPAPDRTPRAQLFFTDGTSITPASATNMSTWTHIVLTWDGQDASIYQDGVLKDTVSGAGRILRPGNTTPAYLWIGRRASGGYVDATIDEVAIYEKALSSERILAHYTAGTRGFDQEATGTRIQNVLDASGLSFPYSLGVGDRQILPVRQFGQSTLDPIAEAEAAEGGLGGFFFNAAGVAVFHDRDYRDTYPYTVNQALFDDDPANADLAYEDLGFDHGERFLANTVRVEAEGGETQEVSDATSITAYDNADIEVTGVPMVTDDDALVEASWLLSRSKTPRWRIPSVGFELDLIDRPLHVVQALGREIGDAVTVARHPKAGTGFTQISSVERVSHTIDFEGQTWVTTYGLAPLADDLEDGWILGVPGATELESTMVLN